MNLEDWEHLELSGSRIAGLGRSVIEIGGQSVPNPLNRAQRAVVCVLFFGMVVGQILKTLIPAVFWLSLGAWGYWFHMVR